jgi:tetratricopeptide (TPR) repeat protein
MEPYYDYITNDEARTMVDSERRMRAFIQQDPDFLDPYIALYENHRRRYKTDKAMLLLNEAYQRALRMVLDTNGNWPEQLEWDWLENRHIIRTFLNRAEALYEFYFHEEALSLYRNIMRTDPRDAGGTRFQILALRMGMPRTKFTNDFGWRDTDGMKKQRWFERHHSKFPEEWEALDWLDES